MDVAELRKILDEYDDDVIVLNCTIRDDGRTLQLTDPDEEDEEADDDDYAGLDYEDEDD